MIAFLRAWWKAYNYNHRRSVPWFGLWNEPEWITPRDRDERLAQRRIAEANKVAPQEGGSDGDSL